MVSIEKIDTDNTSQAKRFVQFYYDLYKDCPQFVPPPFGAAYLPLNRKKHPFFEPSAADFFVAVQDGKVVGRICVADNRPFNTYHKTKKAHFFQFDAVDDLEVARRLFEAAYDWSRARGLDTMIGPKGLSPFDGYGIQIEGFEHRTTTRRELFVAPDGGMWIDTPGMRELAQWIDDEAGDEPAFDDIAALAAGCRFRDCRHQDEPGCAVRGAVPADRLASFHKLAGERSTGAIKQHAAKRIEETRKAKAKRYAPRPGKPDDET